MTREFFVLFVFCQRHTHRPIQDTKEVGRQYETIISLQCPYIKNPFFLSLLKVKSDLFHVKSFVFFQNSLCKK